MEFELKDEHRLLRQTVRDFVDREIQPFICEWDVQGQLDPNVIPKMAALGLMGAPIPEQYGGGAMDYLSLAIIAEELEKGDTAFRTIMSVHVALNSLTLLQWGTEEQKQRYLVPQARGEKLAVYCLTEPNVGSDAANLETRATREGGDYVLNGTKTWISCADLADHFLVFATVDPSQKTRGICAFIVERTFGGVTTHPIKGKLGIRSGNTGTVHFENVRVPKENLLGDEGEGFKIAMSALDWGRFTIAAGAIGLTEACLGASVRYANERHAFGQPIGRFQLVQQMIANMVRGLETSRALVYRLAELKNRGLRTTRETSLAKWHATEVAMQAALDAVQIHGAYGYSNEYPVERYLRNAKAPVIYEGTSQIHTILQGEYALGYREDRPLRCPPPKAPGY